MGFMDQLEAVPSQWRWMMIPILIAVLGGGYWFLSYKPQAEVIAEIERRQGGVILMHDFDSYARVASDTPHAERVLSLTGAIAEFAKSNRYMLLTQGELLSKGGPR